MSNKEAILGAFSHLFEKIEQEIHKCVAEEFLISVRQNGWNSEEIAEAMQEYLEQDVRKSGEIYARQTIIEKKLDTLETQLNRVYQNAENLPKLRDEFNALRQSYHITSTSIEKLREEANILPELTEELGSLRTEYSASINSVRVSVDAIKNSSDVLTNYINNLDQSIARLATNDGVRASLAETEKRLVSKQDLEAKASLLEEKIKDARNTAWMQFAITIAALVLGFLAVIGTIFVAVLPLLQGASNDSTSSSEPSTSIPSPSVPNSPEG